MEDTATATVVEENKLPGWYRMDKIEKDIADIKELLSSIAKDVKTLLENHYEKDSSADEYSDDEEEHDSSEEDDEDDGIPASKREMKKKEQPPEKRQRTLDEFAGKDVIVLKGLQE